VLGGEHGKFVPVKDAVAGFLFAIGPLQKFLVPRLQLFQFQFECGFGHVGSEVKNVKNR
jgi:hypothetical protein